MPNPPTSEQVAKLAAELTVDAHLKEVAKLEAAKLLAQHDVEMGLLREAGLNVDRAKVADDGSREEVD
jgi:hypothetical protein